VSKLDELKRLAQAPIVFSPNETWRLYTGGKLIRQLRGIPDAQDSFFPEDWIASVSRAVNPRRDGQPALEGLSVVRDTDVPFALLVELFPEALLGEAHLAKFGPTTGVLAKFLDSSVRLPIQAHPDDALAQKHWGERFGKTEAWIIVATRVIEGVEPYILFGFKPGVTRERFRKLVDAMDLEGQVACLHRIPVQPGDSFLVTSRTAHAIGSGVFMIEVQQPSDLVIQTESRCAGEPIPPGVLHMGKGWDAALEVFEYGGEELEALMARARLEPQTLASEPGGSVAQIVSHQHTRHFAARKLIVGGRLRLGNERFYAGAVVAGSGALAGEFGEIALGPGDTFFVPNAVRAVEYHGQGLEIILADPPAIAA
jgi:mannose-6-phosphate isomerase